MNLRLPALVGTVILGLALTAMAGSDNATKIVGVWDVVKSEGAPPGSSIEFTKDRKVKLTARFGEKSFTMDGTYKVKEDKITVTLTYNGKSKDETATIKKLTAKELQLQDDSNGVIAEYKRAK